MWLFLAKIEKSKQNPWIKVECLCGMLCLALVLACRPDKPSVSKGQVIQTLRDASGQLEKASHSLHTGVNWELRAQTFTDSTQSAKRLLESLQHLPAKTHVAPCDFSASFENTQEGCRLLTETLLRLFEMNLYGQQGFLDGRWERQLQAAKNLAISEELASEVQNHLLKVVEFYGDSQRRELDRESQTHLYLGIFIVLFVIVFCGIILHLLVQFRSQNQQLRLRDQAGREYTRKLELIGREVRRLRDLGAAVDAAAGILVFDQHHKLQSANERFCSLLGLNSKDSLQGLTMPQILGLQNPETAEPIIEALAEKEIWRGELNGKHHDGSDIWMYVLFYPQLDDLEDVEGSLALVLDITESKKAQLTLSQTQHLMVLGEVAGGIAHEINNPLTVIAGRTSALLKKVHGQQFDPATFQNGLEQIQKTVHRIAKIVESMRKLSRSDGGISERREESVDTIIRETLEFTEEKLKKFAVALTLEDKDGVGSTKIATQGFGLSQILVNLISNAVDAIESNHEVDRWIRLVLERRDQGFIAIKVVDCGKGIPKAIRDRIMDPFFTTKPVGQGTGIGLSLSQKIAHDHGGKLFYDEQAEHTTFVLELSDARQKISEVA